MFGGAVANGEVLKDFPNAVYCVVPSGTVDTTKTLLISPDHAITPTVPTMVQDGSSQRWAGVFTPNKYGVWTLVLRNSSDAVLKEVQFRCVGATPEQMALGLHYKKKGYVIIWSQNIVGTGSVSTTAMSSQNQRTFVTDRKQLAPYSGYVFGVSVRANANILVPDSVQFVSVSNDFRLDGISEDIRGLTPLEGAWASGYRTVLFNKAVPIRIGNRYGVHQNDTSNSGTTTNIIQTEPSNTNSSAQARILVRNAALNMDGGVMNSGEWSQFGTTLTHLLSIKLLMNPPAIALGGLSHWAGSPNSAPPVSDTIYPYVPADCMAAMLEDYLGVPVMNCAKGGTTLNDWLGPTGLFETQVKDFNPSVFLFDTTYNDAFANYSDSEYLNRLDRLLGHCAKNKAQLVLLEGFGSYNAYVNPGLYGDRIERYDGLKQSWANQNFVGYIPLRWRLSETPSGGEPTRKLQQKRWELLGDSGFLPDYDLADVSGDNRVHLSRAGRETAALTIAEWFLRRQPIDYRPLSQQTKTELLTPAQSTESSINKIDRIAERLRIR